jgi:hypothetical protein
MTALARPAVTVNDRECYIRTITANFQLEKIILVVGLKRFAAKTN